METTISANYQKLTLSRNDNARLRLRILDRQSQEPLLKAGTYKIRGIPKTIGLQSIVLLSNGLYDSANQRETPEITLNSSRFYDGEYNQMTTPRAITAVHNGSKIEGILLYQSASLLRILVDGGKIMEMTSPFAVLNHQNNNDPFPYLALKFKGYRNGVINDVPNASSKLMTDIEFHASGLSWDCIYHLNIDFKSSRLLTWTCMVTLFNNTDDSILNAEVKLLEKAMEPYYRSRSLSSAPMAAMASESSYPPAGTVSTLGTTSYSLGKIDLEEKSQVAHNLFELRQYPIMHLLSYDILSAQKHPRTLVQMRSPVVLAGRDQDTGAAIPRGKAEIRENGEWLTTADISSTPPGEKIILDLGVNAYIEVITTIFTRDSQQIATVSPKPKSTMVAPPELEIVDSAKYDVTRYETYDVAVFIQNNSNLEVLIDPYHRLTISEADLTSPEIEHFIVDSENQTSMVIKDHQWKFDSDQYGVHFRLPTLRPKEKIRFAYSLTVPR